MEINWEKEVLKRKDNLLKDIMDLVEIKSVRDIEHGTKNEPLGFDCAQALQKFLSYGKRDGFQIKNVDNLAGHIEFGNPEAEAFGILGHVDVVPAGDGWNTNPFKPVIKDGKLFGRGVSDDKGPSIAAYYGMKIIKELGLPITKKIRFIVGTDEESEWLDIKRYQEVEEMPEIGFSPDANFPIINGEKGIATYTLTMELFNDTEELLTFSAGLRSNMVPGEAEAKLSIVDESRASQMIKAFGIYLGKHSLSGKSSYTNETLQFTLKGRSAHAQTPQDGINAATHLATFLAAQGLAGSGAIYVEIISSLHEDYYGENLGVSYVDDVMGSLTSSPNIFTYQASNSAQFSINVRYPKGITPEKIKQNIAAKFGDRNFHIKMENGVKYPHYVSGDDPFIKTLIDVYEEHTGEKGYELTIGGGTYGRLLKKGCAYGALFPERENVMHQSNEYMFVEDILKSAAIYADAIYRLVK